MTSVGSVASITKTIGDFSDLMTAGMKKKVRKHFREYLLGMMIPPEIRRKSISNISSLVSEYDQSTLNRAIHAVIRSEKSPIVLVIDATEPMDVIQSSDKHSKVA